MRTILGISAFYHDSAATILIDGKIIAAAQEERFTRKKHDNRFPKNAIKFLLENSNCSLNEIDKIISVLFTVTHDLTEVFPAKAIRELGYTSIPVIDTLAPNIKNDLKGCIRVMVYYEENIVVKHVYLGEAKTLRPDR